MTTLLVLLALAPSTFLSAGLPDQALLALAEQSFAEGVTLRADAAKARPAFARAAIAYDDLWARGHRSPELALDRAHAHQLAGDLPGAIVVLHEGLDAAGWSRPLQAALEEARSRVAYPHTGDLAAQCRPPRTATIGIRMSPLEAWTIAGSLWLISWACVARFAMTRAVRWLTFAGVGVAALGVLGALWLQDYRAREREEAEPLVVVARDAYLRKGNSDAWPERLEARLPRGVEARELSRRGGWVQVRLAGGVVGWLPEGAVLSRANS
jgi:hypothetical protein